MVLGNRSCLPMAGPVVLDKDQPRLALGDYVVEPVVLHLDLPMVGPELLGWDLPMLELGLAERKLVLDSC